MSKLQQVGSHKTTIYTTGGYTCVKYHDTDVVKFNYHEVILNSGGFRTSTTKLRMNQAASEFGLGYRVFQKNFEWFVQYNGVVYNFIDGMVFNRTNI